MLLIIIYINEKHIKKIFDLLVNNINNVENSNLQDFGITDENMSDYIDCELANGGIVKHSQYNFTCCGWVDKINKSLKGINSKVYLEAEDKNIIDKRIDVRVKGQGCYFILYKDEIAMKSGILTWV